MAALRLHDLDHEQEAWVGVAGIPIYLALFGRDTLTVAWQCAAITSQVMRGTLPTIAHLQGRVVDDRRDEQPGRMLHGAHTGPLAKLGFNPRARYTVQALLPVSIQYYSRNYGTGPGTELIRPLIESALRALRWKDEASDLDNDSFYEYQTHSSQGVKNQ